MLLIYGIFTFTSCGFAQEMDYATFLTSVLSHSSVVQQAEIQLQEAKEHNKLANSPIQFNLNIDTNLSVVTGNPVLAKDQFQSAVVAAQISGYGPLGLVLSMNATWQNQHKFGTEYQFSPLDKEKYQVELQLSRSLFRSKDSLPQYQASVRAQQLVQEREISLIRIKKQVLLEAAEGFFTLWRNQELLRSLHKKIQWANDQVELLSEMIAKNLTTELDLLNAELQLMKLELESTSIKNQDYLYRQSLKMYHGIPKTIQIVVEPPKWYELDISELINLPSGSLEKKQAETLYEVALNELTQLQAELQLQGQLQFSLNHESNWQIKLAFQRSLFEVGATKVKLKTAESQVTLAKTNLDLATFNYEQLLIKNDNLVNHAYSQLSLANERMVLAQKYQAIVEKRNKVGVASFEERYSSVERMQETYLNLVEAQINYYLCLLKRQLMIN